MTVLTLSASCGNWLDVLPKSEADEEEMFETANGYYSTLTGVYINMASSELYGGNLTLGMTEPLTHQYDIERNNAERQKWAEYDYTTQHAQDALLDIWSAMYNNIVNCNLLIKHLREEERTLFPGKGGDQLLGEALGLRAYMYFDLARMFNESLQVNATSANVPYKTDFGLTIGSKLQSTVLLDSLLKDLQEAGTLLADADPLMTGEQYPDKYLNYQRTQRMNYYAVQGLMARIHLYRADYRAAYACARLVLDSGKFSLATGEGNSAAGKDELADPLFSSELLFGLYTENLLTLSRATYEGLTGDLIKSTNCYASEDPRRAQWHAPNTTNGINLVKYKRSSDASTSGHYPNPVAPMLRLGEMYLIAAEAALHEPAIGADPVAILNGFKAQRQAGQLSTSAASDEITKEITHEYICEFRGEGQLFWYYKRLNHTTIDNGHYQGGMVAISPASYTFPLPQYEIDFGGK